MAPLKPAQSYQSCCLNEPVKLLACDQNLADILPQTIPEYFHECCKNYKNYPALAYQRPRKISSASEWTTVTYGEYKDNVEQAALALLYLEIPPRTSVCILAANCPEWFYIQLGALRINTVVAGIYRTNSPESVFHVLLTSDASVVVVDDSLQMSKVKAVRSRLPQLRAVVQLNGPLDFDEEGYYSWPDLINMKFSSDLHTELLQRERNVAPNDCALLIFTVSGFAI